MAQVKNPAWDNNDSLKAIHLHMQKVAILKERKEK